MKFKDVVISEASTEAKVAALALLLDKELIKLADTVLNVKKLEGPKGEQGIQGPKGEQGDRGFDGTNGKDGADGKDGKDGEDGKQGVGVADAKIDFDGSLVITLTDGTEINAGDVVPLDTAEKIRVIGNGGGTSQSVLDAIDAINAIIATYGTMATQNANAVAITGGSINGTSIGATTPSTGVFTTLTATGQTSLGGAAGSEGLRVTPLASSTTYINARAGVNGGNAQFGLNGTGNTDFIQYTLGTGAFRFLTNGIGVDQFRIAHTASAVNYVQVTGNATNGAPTISAQGSDANVFLDLKSKGSNQISLYTGGGIQFAALHAASAVNYTTAKGSATGNGVVFGVNGTDTNISQVFQSKGTGAIDLAAGSRGVNISNGGTVTAITVTANGSSFTGFPTWAASAPTTAGGVTASGTVTTLAVNSVSIASGGTGYTVGDLLTVQGGTFSAAQLIQVATVSGGVIQTVNALTINTGVYTALPASPASVTGGTGSGATFTLTYRLLGGSSGISITNAGSGYVEQPTVSFSGGGGSGAAAYATVGSTPTLKSIHTQLSVQTAGGEVSRFLSNQSGVANGRLDFGVDQFSRGIISGVNSLVLTSTGTGSISFQTNSTAQQQMVVAHTASAVNYVQVTGAATGSGVTLSAQGSDTNIGVFYNTKGFGSHQFRGYNGSNTYLTVGTSQANPVNSLQLAASSSGNPLTISALGSDTNIPIVLQPKGTGALQAQQTDSTATGGNARGANAVDWQTGRSVAAQVASGANSGILGGFSNTASGQNSAVASGAYNICSGYSAVVAGGYGNQGASGYFSGILSGYANTAAGYLNLIVGGYSNSGTSASAVTTQSATMNGTTAVTLSGANASIKVGQLVTGTSISNFPNTYVAAISGTSLTLSQAASGSSTSTLSFYTPHGVVVGGGNNQATGSYSFIGGGGDAGTAANRNVASGDWSVVAGGWKNVASGNGSFIGGGGYLSGSAYGNTASGQNAVVVGGIQNTTSGQQSFIGGGYNNTANGVNSVIVGSNNGTTRSIDGFNAFPASNGPIVGSSGVQQSGLLILGRQTTDATATVLTSNTSAAGTTNQVILPNNSAYYFKGTVVAGVTGGGNTKGWTIEGVIKRGANAASTAIVGTATVTSSYADAGASTWALTATADTTNGGLAITATGQAATTIRWVCKIETTEMTY